MKITNYRNEVTKDGLVIADVDVTNFFSTKTRQIFASTSLKLPSETWYFVDSGDKVLAYVPALRNAHRARIILSESATKK
jgi:hypothetical protein